MYDNCASTVIAINDDQVPTPPPPANPEAAHPAPSLPVFERLLSNNKKFMQTVLSQGSKYISVEPV